MSSKDQTFTGNFKHGLKHGYGKETEGKEERLAEYREEIDKNGSQLLTDQVRKVMRGSR